MDRYFSGVIIVFIVFLFSHNPAGADGMSVVDYYKACPAKYFGNNKPALEFKNGQWTTNVGMGMATVDTKNGYIECSAVGDGEDIMQFVLYVKSDKTPIVAINRYYHTGVGPYNESSKVVFYEYNNKEFRDVSRDILPEIDFRIFCEPGFDMAKLDKIKSFKLRDHILFRHVLPQKGTSIIVGISLSRLHEYLEKHGTTLLPGEKDLCEKFSTSIDYTKGIELKWDSQKNKFVVGGRVKLPY